MSLFLKFFCINWTLKHNFWNMVASKLLMPLTFSVNALDLQCQCPWPSVSMPLTFSVKVKLEQFFCFCYWSKNGWTQMHYLWYRFACWQLTLVIDLQSNHRCPRSSFSWSDIWNFSFCFNSKMISSRIINYDHHGSCPSFSRSNFGNFSVLAT